MKLKSTFGDYYDWAFDRDGPVFTRTGGNTGPPKREQFRILEGAGFRTPPHGLVGDVLGSWWDDEKKWVRRVVAYTDEMAHCTEGKVVYGEWQLNSNPHMGMPGGDRHWREKELYCSAFVGNYHQVVCGATPAVSWRRLQVGPHVFWVEYTSTESWMSNFGDGACEVVDVRMNEGYHPHIRMPLWAADFVLGREMYAVDLNSAPGMRGSGVEKYLPAPEVVRAIEGWYEEFGHE